MRLPLLAAAAALVALPPAAGLGQWPGRRHVVVVVDGAADYRQTTERLCRQAAHGTPLEVVRFDWSRGPGYVDLVIDQTDQEAAHRAGHRLACDLAARLAADPFTPVSVLAYSAGCFPALIGSGQLPPESLSRVVLLAPSVSEAYDLTPNLRVARRGVHNFYSRRDIFALGFGIRAVGTGDDPASKRAAGRWGFLPPASPCLAHRLVQYPWTPADRQLGRDGLHHGVVDARYLGAVVVPLLLAE